MKTSKTEIKISIASWNLAEPWLRKETKDSQLNNPSPLLKIISHLSLLSINSAKFLSATPRLPVNKARLAFLNQSTKLITQDSLKNLKRTTLKKTKSSLKFIYETWKFNRFPTLQPQIWTKTIYSFLPRKHMQFLEWMSIKKKNNFASKNIKIVSSLLSPITPQNVSFGISLESFIWVDGKQVNLEKDKNMVKVWKLSLKNIFTRVNF